MTATCKQSNPFDLYVHYGKKREKRKERELNLSGVSLKAHTQGMTILLQKNNLIDLVLHLFLVVYIDIHYDPRLTHHHLIVRFSCSLTDISILRLHRYSSTRTFCLIVWSKYGQNKSILALVLKLQDIIWIIKDVKIHKREKCGC